MLDFGENRSNLIRRVLAEVSDQTFEYESSEIIQSLFESKILDTKFKDRKLNKKTFFPNSHNYIKRWKKNDE